ncbi:MAG: molybdate ABC transporter substrate-binding protein [Saprospirales bacterium]|nr:molybdate ABC transporter substrate-binding protein [Saprospirales bacterium]
MHKIRGLGMIFFTLWAVSCGQAPETEPLTVAVAANAQFALKEIEAAFEAQTGIAVEVITGSSGKLSAQIRQGAPYDVFVSADTKYPEYLFREGKGAEAPRTYAFGALVLWTLKDLDISKGPALLADPAIQKIGIPNPQTAPYGEQAMRVLEHYQLLESVRDRLVFGESIAQANQYILSGACELGFTAKSVVMAPDLRGKGYWIELDKSAYLPIAQAALLTGYGKERHPHESRQFYDYLFSPQGRAIFQKFGYELPE